MTARTIFAALTVSAVILAPAGAFAGARGHGGPMLRPGTAAHGNSFHFSGPGSGRGFNVGRGFGGAGRAFAPVAGVARQGFGHGTYYTAYGHLDTGSGLRGRTGLRSVSGASYNEGRFGQNGARFGRGRQGLDRGFANRYGRGIFLGGGYGGSYFGGDLGGGYGGSYGGPYDAGSSGTAPTIASEPPLSSGYAENALGPSNYGGYGDDGYGSGQGSASGEGYGGGPQIIVISDVEPSRARRCPCGPARATHPVVYRYGVPSPY